MDVSTGATTTGSFKNQPRTRKRGISAVLHDSSNIELSERHSKQMATSSICSKKAVSRGRHITGTSVATSRTETDSICMNCIDTYIARNASFEIQKAFAIRVYGIASTKWGKGIMDSAEMASDVVGRAPKTVRTWASSFFGSVAEFHGPIENLDNELVHNELSSDRGHGCGNSGSIIHDEEFQLKAREFIRTNSCKKGEPNLTVENFKGWIKDSFEVSVSHDTARVWLLTLGFTQHNHKKGVFFDGHERDDVTQYRSKFVDLLLQYDQRTIVPDKPLPLLLPGEKPIIRVVHDESTFYANAMQTCFWADGELQILRQKSLGQAIMVSDFIIEGEGYLRDECGEGRLLLETQSEGYFNSDKFLDQVDRALGIFNRKYPHATGLFMFDHAPCHKKVADDALNVDHMNVNPGGKQAVLRDTEWDGQVQRLVTAEGIPKGMKLVLQERGVNTSGMNAGAMRSRLQSYDDFSHQKTLLEEKVESHGHICMYFPKYHCELNAIERNWCHAKKYTRSHNNGSIVRLRKLVPESLETVSVELMNKFFSTCRLYEKAYREGKTGKTVEAAVKTYKSHRRVFSINQ